VATSTIPNTKAALFDLLVTALDGIQMEWARPSEDAMAPESVWFEGTEGQQGAETLGNQRRDENFTLKLLVSVLRDGDDARGVEMRMWEIVAIIETVVRQNAKPIPAQLFDIQYAGATQTPHQAEGQRASEALVRIAGRARI